MKTANNTGSQNVQLTMERIQQKSPVMNQLMKEGKLKMIGAITMLHPVKFTIKMTLENGGDKQMLRQYSLTLNNPKYVSGALFFDNYPIKCVRIKY